jgi:hypothetical protein
VYVATPLPDISLVAAAADEFVSATSASAMTSNAFTRDRDRTTTLTQSVEARMHTGVMAAYHALPSGSHFQRERLLEAMLLDMALTCLQVDGSRRLMVAGG